jgi:hypothetical protein
MCNYFSPNFTRYHVIHYVLNHHSVCKMQEEPLFITNSCYSV